MPAPVDQFLRDKIDTVPHLEALLLLWNSRPKTWSGDSMAHGLFLAPEAAREILEDLVREGLVETSAGEGSTYRYASEPARDQLLDSVDSTYCSDLIRVTRLIHSKPSAAVRAFARAFQIKKEGN